MSGRKLGKTSVHVIFMTMGRSEILFRQIEQTINYLVSQGLQVSYLVSLNDQPSKPAKLAIKENLIREHPTVIQNTFLDSVEEHLYELLNTIDNCDLDADSWIWPMPEDEYWDFANFEKILSKLTEPKCDLLYINQKWTVLPTFDLDNRLYIEDQDYAPLSLVALNSGIDGMAKLGAWVIRLRVVKQHDLTIWRSWLEFTTLFSHSFYFIMLSLQQDVNGYFIKSPLIILQPNETDVDLSESWLVWYEERGRVFQFDWTIGQLLIMRDLVERDLISRSQISSMLISDKNRGVLSQIFDIQWRLHLAMLRSWKDPKLRFPASYLKEALDFLGTLRNQDLDYLKNLEICLSDVHISSRRRLQAFKYCNSFWDRYQHYDLMPLLIEVNSCSKLYARINTVVTAYETNQRLILENLAPTRDKFIHLVLRDSSENGIRHTLSAQHELALLTDATNSKYFNDFAKEIGSEFNPFLVFPWLQIMMSRIYIFRRLYSALGRIRGKIFLKKPRDLLQGR